jgi:hypothetical protein
VLGAVTILVGQLSSSTIFPMTAHKLKALIDEFLEERILSKSEEDRSDKDRVVLSTGRGFGDVLFRYERKSASSRAEKEYAKVSDSFSVVASLEPSGDE